MTRRDKGVPRGARWGSWEWDAAGGWQLQGPSSTSRERRAEGMGGFECDLHENPLLILPRRSTNLSLSVPHPSRCCLHPPAPCRGRGWRCSSFGVKPCRRLGGLSPVLQSPGPINFPPPRAAAPRRRSARCRLRHLPTRGQGRPTLQPCRAPMQPLWAKNPAKRGKGGAQPHPSTRSLPASAAPTLGSGPKARGFPAARDRRSLESLLFWRKFKPVDTAIQYTKK